jgi:phosphatidylserine decarboxylase
MDFADSLKTAIHPPHRAGYPFILGGLVLAVLGLLFWHILAWAGLIFTLFCLYFFRDPERVAPPRVNVFLAPADGLVTSIEPAIPPPELGLPPVPMMRVATFLSVLDVHVNRAAIAGTVARIAYHPGLFLNAAAEKAADENERNAILFHLPNGAEAVIVQIAGLIARRIVCDLHEGQVVAAGQRIGIIRFGSRTDLYLPPGCLPLVAVGQRMIGGETVIAELMPAVTAPLPAR